MDWILANLVGGLGLFFSGLRLVGANLRQAAGRQLRAVIGHLTRNRRIAGIVGVVTGTLVQSSSGVVFILVSLETTGLTTVRQALPIVTWANVGGSLLIFAAVLDLRLAVLYLIGVAGVAFAFDRSHRNHALGALFGIGMLFYGIELMKTGAQPLRDQQWFSHLLEGNTQSLLLAFAGSVLFSFVTHSSTAVAILCIGFAVTGLLGPFPTMMALYGANLGSTFSRMVLSSNLRGSARQIPAFQDLFKITGAVVFVSLLYLEAFERVPLVYALVGALSSRIDRQMALVFLIFNLSTAIVFSLAQPLIERLLAKVLPADEHDDLSKPRFLYDEALKEPATALDLIEQEQLRLAKRLRAYSDALRSGPGSPQRARARTLQTPFAAVAARIETFQQELVDELLGSVETERLTNLQNRMSLLIYVEDSLRALTAATEATSAEGRLAALLSTFVEGLDFVLATMIDAFEGADDGALALLIRITDDRGDLTDRLRQDFLAEHSSISRTDRAGLLQVTSMFERVVWIIQRLARLLQASRPLRAIQPSPSDAAATVPEAWTSSSIPPG
jgi:phosphate:Na+ symporter